VRWNSRRRAARRAATIILLASALSLVSCQRTASSRAAPAGSAGQAAAAAGKPATAISRKSDVEQPKPAPATETGGRTPAPRAAETPPIAQPAPVFGADTGLFGLLGQGPQDGTLPEDFEIGPLGAARVLCNDERAAYQAAASLLDAFTRGRADRAWLAAGSREALAGTISFALEQGDRPVAWRLGPPRASGDELVANMRLLGTEGSAEGELYARREGGEFRVSDLQIDPARMRVRRERPDRTFFPSPYRWLLGG
jgi:hypothetical protein